MSQRSFDQGRTYGGNTGNFGGQNGFNNPQQQQQPGMMNPMYGGMTPALMAQWYQRMQAYYATMGRGMMPGMGMNQPMMGAMPNMNMPGMPMGPGMQMMGMPPQQPGQQQMGYQAMSQGFVGSPPPPPQQPHHFQQEPSSHEGK